MAAEPAPPAPNLWIVGGGRLGLALALALRRSGAAAALTVSGRAPSPPHHPLFLPPQATARYQPDLAVPHPCPDVLVVAVPDGEIAPVAAAIARRPERLPAVALHTSGALDSGALAPLAQRGCATGSLHPLLAISDPVQGAERLSGAWFGVEGHPRAVQAAGALVAALAGRTLPIAPGAKPLYHAAAVFASNYLVALLATAERLLTAAGAPDEAASGVLAALARSAVDAVAERGAVDALTGPVSRGDTETLRLHLTRLSVSDAALYSVLARATLEVARARGLDPRAAAEIERLLMERT